MPKPIKPAAIAKTNGKLDARLVATSLVKVVKIDATVLVPINNFSLILFQQEIARAICLVADHAVNY